MSLVLDNAEPSVMVHHTHYNHRGAIDFGDYNVPMTDFLEAVWYVLTNTDLLANDPRLEFIKNVSQLKEVEGWNIRNDPAAKRLEFMRH